MKSGKYPADRKKIDIGDYYASAFLSMGSR